MTIEKLKYVYIESFDKYDYESIIKCFWWHSVSMRLEEFDFDEAFESLSEPLQRKLDEHGLGSYEDFYQNQEDLCMYDFSQFQIQTNFFYFGEEEAKEAIFKAMYEKYKNEFEGYGVFEDLQEILDEIEKPDLTTQQKNELMDRIIHAQHVTGYIFEDIDMDALHKEVDEEMKEILIGKPCKQQYK